MDLTKLASYGIAGVAIAALGITFLIVKLMMTHMQATNAVVQANTKAINGLTKTLDRSSILEEQFREEIMELSKGTHRTVNDIHTKVKDIHVKVVS